MITRGGADKGCTRAVRVPGCPNLITPVPRGGSHRRVLSQQTIEWHHEWHEHAARPACAPEQAVLIISAGTLRYRPAGSTSLLGEPMLRATMASPRVAGHCLASARAFAGYRSGAAAAASRAFQTIPPLRQVTSRPGSVAAAAHYFELILVNYSTTLVALFLAILSSDERKSAGTDTVGTSLWCGL